MFDRFKVLARILFVIIALNFLVYNFGIESKIVEATTNNSFIDQSDNRVINYDLKADKENNYLIFDFSKYLGEKEKIDSFELKKGNTVIDSSEVDSNKKAWKAKFLPVGGDKYTIKVTATINGHPKKLLYDLKYNDYDSQYKIEPEFINGNDLEVNFDTNWINLFSDTDKVIFDVFRGSDKIVTKDTKTIRQIKDAGNRVVYSNKKGNLKNKLGYFIEAKVKGRVYRWQLFVNNDGTKITNTAMELKNGTLNSSENKITYDVLLKENIDLNSKATLKRIDGVAGTISSSDKLLKFENDKFNIDSYYTVLIESNNEQYGGSVGICVLNHFEKLDFKSNLKFDSKNELDIELQNSHKLLSQNKNKSSITIYELDDNYGKNKIAHLSGAKDGINTLNIGEKTLTKNKVYLVELMYSNGSLISTPFVYTPLTTSIIDVKNTSARVKWEYPKWYKPVDGDKIEIFLRDKNGGNFNATANLTLINGKGEGKENFNTLKEKVITNISPNVEYEAKIVLSNNNRSSYMVDYKEFISQNFRLKDYIKIKDAYSDENSNKIAYPRSRDITVSWDYEPENMQFSQGDKVEIYVKPDGSEDFSGYPKERPYTNPVFTATHTADKNLSEVKEATITLPSWLYDFHVDLIYTIGGKKIITNKPRDIQGENAYNRKTVKVKVNNPALQVTDITQNSAKVQWAYDGKFSTDEDTKNYMQYKPENGHAIKLYMKKVDSSTDNTNTFDETKDLVFYFTQGGSVNDRGTENGNKVTDISSINQYVLNNLEPNQDYRIKLMHILQNPNQDTNYPGADENYRSVEEYYNFKTEAFELINIKAQQFKRSPKIVLSWDTLGITNLKDEDKVKIYAKETTTSEYNEKPNLEVSIEELKKNASNTIDIAPGKKEPAAAEKAEDETTSQTEEKKPENRCRVELPKYNTPYNIKIEYTVGDKVITGYALAEARGELELNILNIGKEKKKEKDESPEKWKADIKWIYPEGYKKGDRDDKVLLLVTHIPSGKQDATAILPNDVDVTEQNTPAEQKNPNVYKLSGLEPGEEYEVTLVFQNDGKEVSKTVSRFKATGTVQVVGLSVSNVKSRSATLKWNYSPASLGTKKKSKEEEKEKSGPRKFKTGDKLEVYIKSNDKNQVEAKDSPQNIKDDLTEYTKIYTAVHQDNTTEAQPTTFSEDKIQVFGETGELQHSGHKEENKDLSTFKSLTLTGLKENKDYSFIVRYNLGESDTQVLTESETKSGKSSYAGTIAKTKADTFKSTVFSSDQTMATYGWEYPEEYELKEGDKIDIYVKEDDGQTPDVDQRNATNGLTNSYGTTPLLTLVHTESNEDKLERANFRQRSGENVININLKENKAVDILGLTPESKYKSAIVFTMDKDNPTVISTEVSIVTKKFAIKSFDVDSYQEYDILAKWEVEPKGMVFSPGDTLDIFVKKATDDSYPEEASYALPFSYKDEDTDEIITQTLDDTFSDYIQAATIGEDQMMKLVYTIGGVEYIKELKFNNKINDLKSNVIQVDQTRAVLGIETPNNYEFVYGDKLLIYAKDEFADKNKPLESKDFLVFEAIESEDLSIADNMKSVELSYLLPQANYEVLVALELKDGTVAPVKLDFRTQALPVTDIKLESLQANNAVISWNYGNDKVDFLKDDDNYELSDKLIIAYKESDGKPFRKNIEELKKFKHVEYVGSEIEGIKDALIEVEDPNKDYDVAVCYDLGGVLYMKQYKTSYLSGEVDENKIENNAAILSWKYPSSVKVEGRDKTQISIRKKSDPNYSDAPITTTTGTAITSYKFDKLEEGTDYVARIQLLKEGEVVEPVEVEFTTRENAPRVSTPDEVVIENVDYEIKGTEAKFEIPNSQDIQVDTSQSIGLKMGDEAYKGFTVKFNENGTGFVIEPTIPKKKYTNIEVELPLKDGKKYKMVIKEFVTQPENVTQDWLSNSYWFAFERYPDEEGYNYWYKDRMLKKDISGEYFLKNLMFAEDEFTNRNLSDNDLIAALYQIVVNREFDQEGLNFWVGIYNDNLKNAQGNKKLAQEVLVDRMVHEPEFGKLCDKAGIFWRQSDQEAAKVPGF